MEISWSTFILEIINFVILVWILQHFLYRPVLDVIARRREHVQKTLQDAQKLREEADGLRQRYEGRLTDWNAEKEQAKQALNREIDAERAARLKQLEDELAREREQAEVTEQRRRDAARREIETQAIKQAGRFTTRLLERVSGPEVEARLIDAAVHELEQLPPEQRAALDLGSVESVGVESAFELGAGQRKALEDALRKLTGKALKLDFVVDTALLAGIRIQIGAKTVALNLHDELEGFGLLSHGD